MSQHRQSRRPEASSPPVSAQSLLTELPSTATACDRIEILVRFITPVRAKADRHPPPPLQCQHRRRRGPRPGMRDQGLGLAQRPAHAPPRRCPISNWRRSFGSVGSTKPLRCARRLRRSPSAREALYGRAKTHFRYVLARRLVRAVLTGEHRESKRMTSVVRRSVRSPALPSQCS